MLFFEVREFMEEIEAIAGRFQGRAPFYWHYSPSGMVPRLPVEQLEKLGFKDGLLVMSTR